MLDGMVLLLDHLQGIARHDTDGDWASSPSISSLTQ